jgi:hypothetical protein
MEGKMSTKFKHNQKVEMEFNPFSFVDFSKASPEAIDAILTALNTEVESAATMNRCPTLDGALGRLSPSSSMMM